MYSEWSRWTPLRKQYTVSQEGAAKGYNPHKRGAVSYHPLLAFCAEKFTKQFLAHLPNRTRILFRGDSGFFSGVLLDLLDQGGHGYLIKVKLKGLAGLLSGQHREPVPGQSGWEQCTFFHQCTAWSTAGSLWLCVGETGRFQKNSHIV